MPDRPTASVRVRGGVSRRLRRLQIAQVVALLLLTPVLWVQAVGLARVRTDTSDVPPTDVAIVFGAGLRPDGTPSTYLRRRLDAAHELYAQGTVKVILVSGDNSRESHDEPTAMRDWLVGLGVPSDRVVLDYAGFDTHDTCVRAHEVFGVTSAVVITQDYHLPRALFSCSEAGVDVVGLGVSSTSVEPLKAVLYRLREAPASARAAWDALTGRDPVYPGPHETSIEDALDDAAD
jgi:vancomycin permeability regulator SanA